MSLICNDKIKLLDLIWIPLGSFCNSLNQISPEPLLDWSTIFLLTNNYFLAKDSIVDDNKLLLREKECTHVYISGDFSPENKRIFSSKLLNLCLQVSRERSLCN